MIHITLEIRKYLCRCKVCFLIILSSQCYNVNKCGLRHPWTTSLASRHHIFLSFFYVTSPLFLFPLSLTFLNLSLKSWYFLGLPHGLTLFIPYILGVRTPTVVEFKLPTNLLATILPKDPITHSPDHVICFTFIWNPSKTSWCPYQDKSTFLTMF